MKAFRLSITIISIVSLLSYSSCKPSSGSGETTQDKQFGLLSAKTWKISTVTLGGVDQSSTWPVGGFQLTVSGTKGASSFNYACAGRPALSPWPASGSWVFDTSTSTSPVTSIIRDKGTADELPITYAVTATSLKISFTYTGTGYTRVSNVSGSWVFTFTN